MPAGSVIARTTRPEDIPGGNHRAGPLGAQMSDRGLPLARQLLHESSSSGKTVIQ